MGAGDFTPGERFFMGACGEMVAIGCMALGLLAALAAAALVMILAGAPL